MIRRREGLTFSIASLARSDQPVASASFLRRSVDAECLECLALINNSEVVGTLWMDEEGKLAQKEIGALVRLRQRGNHFDEVTDALAGNLVIAGPADEEGNVYLLPEEMAVDICDLLNAGGCLAVNSSLHLSLVSLPSIADR